MKYCMDSSVFIEAHRRYYGFDIAPGFWTAIENEVANGKIISIRNVYTEISEGKDQLTNWTQTLRSTLFVEPDGLVVENMRFVADFIENNYDASSHKIEFLRNADPWVIALARAYDMTVVTGENGKKEDIHPISKKITGKIKIPNVCDKLKIPCIDTFTLLRQLNIKLSLL